MVRHALACTESSCLVPLFVVHTRSWIVSLAQFPVWFLDTEVGRATLVVSWRDLEFWWFYTQAFQSWSSVSLSALAAFQVSVPPCPAPPLLPLRHGAQGSSDAYGLECGRDMTHRFDGLWDIVDTRKTRHGFWRSKDLCPGLYARAQASWDVLVDLHSSVDLTLLLPHRISSRPYSNSG